MKVAIIGNGLIGQERLNALKILRSKYNIDQIYVFDILVKNKRIDLKDKVFYTNNFNDLITMKPDFVIIATPHNVVLDYAKKIKYFNCKVLIEKPLGRNIDEAIEIKNNLDEGDIECFVGFNYRFFGGVKSLLKDFEEKKFGEIISVNMVLGHGGSDADKDSWKLDPIKGSANSLLDPGIHFLDIINKMFYYAKPIFGEEWSGFWNTGIGEENHLILRDNKTIINLQTSLAKWRSTFIIEVNGADAYGIVEGRGKSYGNQTYVFGERWGWRKNNMSQPQRMTEKTIFETDCKLSFYDELDAILGNENLPRPCDIYEALANMLLYEECKRATLC